MAAVAPLRKSLSTVAIFGGLSDAQLDRVVQMMVETRHDKGSVLCREGDLGRSMYLILSGEVVVCRQASEGTQVKVVRLGPGDLFGEMTLIDVQRRSATVIADEPTTVLALTNRDLYTLYQEDVGAYVLVLQNICRELSRRLRRADACIAESAESNDDDTTQLKRPAGSGSGARLR